MCVRVVCVHVCVCVSQSLCMCVCVPAIPAADHPLSFSLLLAHPLYGDHISSSGCGNTVQVQVTTSVREQSRVLSNFFGEPFVQTLLPCTEQFWPLLAAQKL